jgi:hypothetical protein
MGIKGRLQAGMDSIEYYTTNFPYANLWKSANWPVVVAGSTYNGSLGPGKSLSPWGVYLDANGDLADPMDGAITEYRRLWHENTTGNATLVGRNMVLVFTGTATTVSFDGSPSNVSRVGGRVTFTVTTDSTNRVKFSGFTDLNDPPKVTYLCFAEDEAALLANPLALSRAYYDDCKELGVIRFMGAMNTNSTRALIRYTDLPDAAYCKWGGDGREGGLKSGLPLAAIASACNELQVHCYFNMPNRLGIAKTGAITAVTRGSTTVIASYPLPANGDEIIFYKMTSGGLGRTFTVTADATTDIFTTVSGDHNLVEDQVGTLTGTTPSGINPIGRTAYYAKVLSPTTFQVSTTRGGAPVNFTTNGGTITVTIELECDKFTVANVNAGAGTFEITGPGSDTTLLSAYSAGTTLNQWSTAFNLSLMEAEMIQVLAYFRDNLDPGLLLFLGYGNETFNSGPNFDQFYWLRAQARHAWPAIDSQSLMYGYLLGYVCKWANDVYGTEGRNRWRGVLEVHLANTGTTDTYITGLQQAVSELAPLTAGDLCYYGAPSGYFGDAIVGSANVATLETWIDDSIAANLSDPTTYPTQYTQFVTKLGQEAYNSQHSLPGDSIDIVEMPALWTVHQGKFQAIGIDKMMQYEGGTHIVVTSSQLGNVELVEFVVEYFGSAAHATNMQQALDLWGALDDVEYPSQYLTHYAPNGNGGWGVRNEIGVDTPVSAALAAYNGDNLIRTRYAVTTTP